MKKLLFAVAALSLFGMNSCNNAELERLQAQNDSLRSVVTTDGFKMDDYFKAFNDIQDNLNSIKEKENIISMKTKNGELSESQGEQINEDILAIYDLMLQNKQTIADLNKKLSNAGVKNTQLQKSLKLLQDQMTSKDKEITSLKEKLSELNFNVEKLESEVADMTQRLEAEQAENEVKTEIITEQDLALNTVYYVFGTKKELVNHKVIDKEGAFKGLKIGDNFDKNYFTKVDLRDLNKIQINSKVDRILSAHPQNSYRMVTSSNGNVQYIEILDQNAFWEKGKFCVIITK